MQKKKKSLYIAPPTQPRFIRHVQTDTLFYQWNHTHTHIHSYNVFRLKIQFSTNFQNSALPHLKFVTWCCHVTPVWHVLITAIRSLSLNIKLIWDQHLHDFPPLPNILWGKLKRKEKCTAWFDTFCTCSRTFCILQCLILFTGYAAGVQVTSQEVKLSTLKSSLLPLSDHLCLCACLQTKIPKESHFPLCPYHFS